MRCAFFVLIATLQICLLSIARGVEPLPWREASAVENDRDAIAVCTISAPKDCKIRAGEKLPITYRIEAIRSVTLYNVFVDGRIPVPFELAVFDPRHEYVGNLLAETPGVSSERPTGLSDWIALQPGAFVGRQAQIRTMRAEDKPDPKRGRPVLPPGKYLAQLVVSERLFSGCPAAGLDEVTWNEWERKWRDRKFPRDYLRSNIVEFEISEE
jgi:hypothetical protein